VETLTVASIAMASEEVRCSRIGARGSAAVAEGVVGGLTRTR
jgi:uncharacterized protein YwlG (UPF0340 family)